MIKIAESNDCQLIAKLNKTVHELHRSWYPEIFQPYDHQQILAFFKGIIQKPEFTFLIIESNATPAGFAWIENKTHPGIAYRKSYQSIYVHQISIEEAFQARGLGAKLMEEIKERAVSQGINRIELDYWAANEPAKAFYTKQGFQPYRESVYKLLW
ncbi:GNAT family N-acetyltransferase [Sediminibacillus albus]|uniref:Acetyltransferase (GNAT) family protein n=1 Tax=Sediminibacillus albus TaxID=407036 RepID=A0A1G8WTW6_9BACI|nr:GNAT family N-acetyltransferase [Sediminibacillus albus]SDJ81819.1 Acetyltransferase (GNAT) family protein [Sediminibacillus albus]